MSLVLFVLLLLLFSGKGRKLVLPPSHFINLDNNFSLFLKIEELKSGVGGELAGELTVYNQRYMILD